MPNTTFIKSKHRSGEKKSVEKVREAIAGLNHLQETIRARGKGKGKLSDAEVRAAIDAGR